MGGLTGAKTIPNHLSRRPANKKNRCKKSVRGPFQRLALPNVLTEWLSASDSVYRQ